MNKIAQKLHRIENVLCQFDSLAVAVSGGMDSTFLAYLATKTLGNKCMAIIARTQFSIVEEIREFIPFAEKYGIDLSIIDIDILRNKDIANNDTNRCYYCKKEIFSAIRNYAYKKNIIAIADGTNLSDDDDFRPGKKALEELGIVSPLSIAGFTKEDIVNAIEYLGVAIPIKYSNSCYATRIEYGTALNDELLRMVKESELVLSRFGIVPVRIRVHRKIARIETSLENVKKITSDDTMRNTIISQLKSIGFTHVAVDIEGYRKGSMNDMHL